MSNPRCVLEEHSEGGGFRVPTSKTPIRVASGPDLPLLALLDDAGQPATLRDVVAAVLHAGLLGGVVLAGAEELIDFAPCGVRGPLRIIVLAPERSSALSASGFRAARYRRGPKP